MQLSNSYQKSHQRCRWYRSLPENNQAPQKKKKKRLENIEFLRNLLNLLNLFGGERCQEFTAGRGSWFHLLQTQVSSHRGRRQISTEQKKKGKKIYLQLQFELISDVSSLAPSQLSQIFGLCSSLSLSAGLSSSVWAKVKTDFKCEQSSQHIIKGGTNSWLHQKKKSFPQEQLYQKSLADIWTVGPLFWTGCRCP